MQRKIGIGILFVLLLGILCGRGSRPTRAGAPAVWTPPPPSARAQGPNLLINGNMDGGGGLWPFYWRPTNHFVAGMWYEWFWTGAIPEFIDGGSDHHNTCYPPSISWYQRCSVRDNHSQGYIRWGASFVAGIYQPVSGVTPCTLYRFEAYNTNQDPRYHAKVGVDPTGQVLPPYVYPDGRDLPRNCPPDYQSACPNPGLRDPSQLPPHIVWSPEYNGVAWTPLTVTAEAVSTTISVWTYAAPEGQVEAMSAYWDEASLVQVPFPGDRLPPPDSETPSEFIQNLTATVLLDKILITWNTPQPASTQVWYNVNSLTGTLDGEYTFATPLDATPKTAHRVVIEGLRIGDVITLTALSRHVAGVVCATEASAPQSVAIPDRLPPDSWTPAGFVQNLAAEWFLDSVVISWDTPEPATTQVWYTISPTLSLSNPVTPDYKSVTPLDLALTTRHTVTLQGFRANETIYFAALSGRVVGDRVSVDVSAQAIAIPERTPHPAMWTPSGAIQNLTATPFLDSLIVEWETPGFSSTTQVWYNVYPPPPPPPPPPTGTLAYTVYIYLPLVQSSPNYQFQRANDFDLRLTTAHRSIIRGLQDREGVSFVALSARLVDGRIVTEVSEARWMRVNVPPIRRIYLPVTMRGS